MGKVYRQYQSRFDEKAQQVKAGPVEERSCTDICCLVTFFILFAFTIVGGIYFMAEGSELIQQMLTEASTVDTIALGQIMAKYAGYVAGMMVLSICLSILFVFLTKTFPKCVVYTMIVLTFVVYLALIILGFVMDNISLSVVFIIVLLINAIILWCYWGYIKIGIVLIECAGRFITEKPAVYFISGMCLLLNVIFTIFWIFSWLGAYSVGVVQAKADPQNNTFQILTYVWYAMAIFFGFFLYYCMVFLVASACAYWYYQSQDNSVMRGFSLLKYQIGAITFASIVITIITMMRILSQTGKNSQNGALRCIAACISCILRCIEEIIKALNHNAVIVMAVMGQGYIDSAKSAIGLIFDNWGLFMIIDFFGEFLEIYQLIICVLIPSILGGGLIYLAEQNLSAAIWGGVIILLLASITSSVIIGMLDEALSCIFIFYCFDKKFHDLGISVNNVPEEVKVLFDRGAGSQEAGEVSQQYLKQ